MLLHVSVFCSFLLRSGSPWCGYINLLMGCLLDQSTNVSTQVCVWPVHAHLILARTLGGWHCCYPHFIDGKTEAQRGEISSPKATQKVKAGDGILAQVCLTLGSFRFYSCTSIPGPQLMEASKYGDKWVLTSVACWFITELQFSATGGIDNGDSVHQEKVTKTWKTFQGNL